MKDNTCSHLPKQQFAGLLRRLLAIAYDLILLTAILLIASALAFFINHGEAIDSNHPLHLLFAFYLLAIVITYFGWFWTHGGQTLGMKTWKLGLMCGNRQSMNWSQALIRFVIAIVSWSALGTGYLWSLFHPQKKTWHDICSGCSILDLRFVSTNPSHQDGDNNNDQ